MATPRKRPEDKLKRGAKSTFKPEYVKLAYNYTLLGADDKDLARFFDTTEQTINNWKTAHPEFFESLKRGKDQADARVSKALFSRALGYSHKEDDIRVCDGSVVITPTTKHYPPDTTAAIFWLKNRQPKKWRDKTEVDNNVIVTDVSRTQYKIQRRKK